MVENTPNLQTKGIRDGLLITLGQGTWSDSVNELIRQIQNQPAFFRGARVAIDVGENELRVTELSNFRNQLSDFGINLWAVISKSQITETTSQNLGLATRLSSGNSGLKRGNVEDVPADAAKWINGPLRSGVKITHAGNILIMGDVNPGSEIVAGGSVIVWGRLRGVVHAGAEGDENAIVCALELAPTQLRISGKIAVSPKKSGKPQPEVARLQNDQLVAEPWHHDRMDT